MKRVLTGIFRISGANNVLLLLWSTSARAICSVHRRKCLVMSDPQWLLPALIGVVLASSHFGPH